MRALTFIVCILFLQKSFAVEKYSNVNYKAILIERTISRKLENLLSRGNVEINIYGEEGSGRRSAVYHYINTSGRVYDIIWHVRKKSDLIYLLSFLDYKLSKDSNISEEEKLLELSRLLRGYNWLLLIERSNEVNLNPIYNSQKINHLIYIDHDSVTNVDNVKIGSLDQKETKMFFKREELTNHDIKAQVYNQSGGNIRQMAIFCNIYRDIYHKKNELFLSDLENHKIKDPLKFRLESLLLKDPPKSHAMFVLNEISKIHDPQLIELLGVKEFLLKNNLIEKSSEGFYLNFGTFSEYTPLFTRRKIAKKLAHYLSKKKPFEAAKLLESTHACSNYIHFLFKNYYFDDEIYSVNKDLLFELVSYLIYEERNWEVAKKIYYKNRKIIYKNIHNREIRRILPVFAFGFDYLGHDRKESAFIFRSYNPHINEGDVYFEYNLQKLQFLHETNDDKDYEKIFETLIRNKLRISNRFQNELFNFLCTVHYFYKGMYKEASSYILKFKISEDYSSSLPLILMRERVIEKLGEHPLVDCENIYALYKYKFKYKGYRDYKLMTKSLMIRKYLKLGNLSAARQEIVKVDKFLEKLSNEVNRDYLIEYMITKARYNQYIKNQEGADKIYNRIISFLNRENIKKSHYYLECYYNLAILHKGNLRKIKSYIRSYLKHTEKVQDSRVQELIRLL